MEQYKQPPSKKQPEPDSLDQQKPATPAEVPPENEEQPKRQTGHEI